MEKNVSVRNGGGKVRFRALRFGIILALAPLALASLDSCAIGRMMRELDAFMVEPGIVTPDLSRVRDGTYTGEFTAGPVTAVVETTVADGVITRCVLVRHVEGRGEGANGIVDTIVAAQSLDIDAVSGATYSSAVIRKATQLALEQGLSEE